MVSRSCLVPAVLAVGLAVSGCGQGGPAGRPTAAPVSISVSDCGSSWQPTAAGPQELTLHNVDSRAGEVQVVGRGALQGRVYADVEPFGPGTSVRLRVPLAAGSYALACLMEDESPVTGPTHTLAGPAHGVPGVRALRVQDLVPATLRYQHWLARRMPRLVHDTGVLRHAVARGDRTGARRAWLAAHLDYLRLGAAYDAFGTLGDRIDGLPQGLPRGVHDRAFRGFHRVELDLWHAAAPGRVAADTRALDHAVRRLPRLVASAQIDPGTLVIRAHEIAENALQFQLTGQDDLGSHSDLAGVRAELAGTAAVLRSLAGPIRTRVAHAAAISHDLTTARRLVDRAARRYAGVAVRRLPRRTRERLDAAVGGLCERLSPVAATLEPRLIVIGSDGNAA